MLSPVVMSFLAVHNVHSHLRDRPTSIVSLLVQHIMAFVADGSAYASRVTTEATAEVVAVACDEVFSFTFSC